MRSQLKGKGREAALEAMELRRQLEAQREELERATTQFQDRLVGLYQQMYREAGLPPNSGARLDAGAVENQGLTVLVEEKS